MISGSCSTSRRSAAKRCGVWAGANSVDGRFITSTKLSSGVSSKWTLRTVRLGALTVCIVVSQTGITMSGSFAAPSDVHPLHLVGHLQVRLASGGFTSGASSELISVDFHF